MSVVEPEFEEFPEAPKRRGKGRLESEVQAGIISYLRLRGDFFFWRSNTGTMTKGKSFVKFGLPGSPDIMGCLAPSGRMFGIEVKREIGGELSKDQKWFRDELVKHGGLFIEARSVEDVRQGLPMGPLVRVVQAPRRKRIYHRG
jgi:hypothetical protein